METCTEEKGWEGKRKILPGGYVWRMQGAKRRKKEESNRRDDYG